MSTNTGVSIGRLTPLQLTLVLFNLRKEPTQESLTDLLSNYSTKSVTLDKDKFITVDKLPIKSTIILIDETKFLAYRHNFQHGWRKVLPRDLAELPNLKNVYINTCTLHSNTRPWLMQDNVQLCPITPDEVRWIMMTYVNRCVDATPLNAFYKKAVGVLESVIVTPTPANLALRMIRMEDGSIAIEPPAAPNPVPLDLNLYGKTVWDSSHHPISIEEYRKENPCTEL